MNNGHICTKIKGTSITARVQYVDEVHGSEVLRRVVERLEPGDRASIEAGLLPSKMYPLELSAGFDRAVAQVIDPQHPIAVYRALGRASAEQNLKSVHSIFLRSRGPHGILEHFPSVRRTYYSDGKASYERTGEATGMFRVVGAVSHTLADCESTAGYFERAIELVGGKEVSVVLRRCRSRGHADCEFNCQWT